MTPFNEGKKDFYKGNLDNPYNVNTYRHREWQRGFNAGYFNNLEKIENRNRNRG